MGARAAASQPQINLLALHTHTTTAYKAAASILSIATSPCRSSVLDDLVACMHGRRSQGVHGWLFTALQHQLYQQGNNKVSECISKATCSMHVSSTEAKPHAAPGLMSGHMSGHAITITYSKVNDGIARANMHSTACMQYSFRPVA